MSSGSYPYWDATWSNIFRKYIGDFFPYSEYKPNKNQSFNTIFRLDDSEGHELCGTSESLENENIRIPEKDLDAFISALDKLHQQAEHDRIPSDTKNFLRNYRIPNPTVMKNCWRVSTGFTRHLFVLWGFTRDLT